MMLYVNMNGKLQGKSDRNLQQIQGVFIDKSPNVMGRNLKECKHGDRKDLGFIKLVQQKSSSGPRKKIYIEKTRLLPC